MMHFMPHFRADLQPLHNAGWVAPHASCQQVFLIFFFLIPLKPLLVKIKPYCSSECIYCCHLWTAFGHHLVKMAPGALTLQIDGNKWGLASLEIPKFKPGLFYVCIYNFFLIIWVLMWLKGEVKPILHLQGAFSKTETERDQWHLLQAHRCANIYKCRVANNNLAQIMSCWKEKYLYTGLGINAVAWRWAWILPKCPGWFFASDGSHHQPHSTPKP